MLLTAERSAPSHVKLERVRGEVRSLEIWRPGHTFILGFQNGHEMTATEVVLALGNPPPAELRGTDELRVSTRLIENAWCGQAPAYEGETVLVVGTGLTMADVVATTMRAGGGPARVHAISRHGLVPPRQTAFRDSHSQFDPLPLLNAASSSFVWCAGSVGRHSFGAVTGARQLRLFEPSPRSSGPGCRSKSAAGSCDTPESTGICIAIACRRLRVPR